MTAFDTSLLPNGDILIGGEWRRGRAAPYASIYPADQSLNMEVSQASAEDAAEAVEAADAAWRRADWAGLKPHQRALVLYRIADLIAQRHEALANLQRRDNGKPITIYPGKVAAICSSSDGHFAGIRSANHLRSVLSHIQMEVIAPQVSVPSAGEAFDVAIPAFSLDTPGQPRTLN